ncbi:hypothetical protein ABIE38_003507 [Dietzia sp. 2505]|uniref:hypothetical protein n=1 Tax=Dietzia sp. 2505 TaxID=3156457 RepID=UPI003396EDD6
MKPILAPPTDWERVALDPPDDVPAAASLLCRGRVHEALAKVPTDELFEQAFWSRLRGPDCHVAVGVPSGLSPALLACLVAAWMGLKPSAMHNDIGGTVSRVVSGDGHRHDQSWHTDSTAWVEPNRYSVLALLAGRPTVHESTDMLPVATVARALTRDPVVAESLAHESVTWRRNFPHLPNLDAPVLGDPVTRWVWPVVEEEMERVSVNLRRGVKLTAHIVNELPFHRPVVSAERLLVFDNWRALHRGPQVERASGRELIRIKVTGVAVL